MQQNYITLFIRHINNSRQQINISLFMDCTSHFNPIIAFQTITLQKQAEPTPKSALRQKTAICAGNKRHTDKTHL